MEKEFFRTRKKFILKAAAFAVIFSGLLYFFMSNWSFAFTRKDHFCFPYKYWFIEKTVMPKKNEYIAFRTKGVASFENKVRWIKMLAAEEGDRIEVERITEKHRDSDPQKYTDVIEVNGMPKKFEVQGIVRIFPKNGGSAIELKAYKTNSKGEALKMIEPQTIPKGKYFVMSPAIRSYDSRYWGLVDESWIIGKAHPLL